MNMKTAVNLMGEEGGGAKGSLVELKSSNYFRVCGGGFVLSDAFIASHIHILQSDLVSL